MHPRGHVMLTFVPTTSSDRVRLTQAERVEQSTTALLAAAVELFAEQGYAATTPSQVSERAGYSRGMVRVRFGSKLGLLQAVVEREFEAPLIAPARDLSLRGIDRMLGIVDALRTMLAEERAFMRATLMVSFESVSTLRELGSHTEAWLSQLEQAVTDALQDGQQDGSVRLDLDCEAEGKHWVATGVGLAFRWCQDHPLFDYDEALLEWRRRLERQCAAPAEDARRGNGRARARS